MRRSQLLILLIILLALASGLVWRGSLATDDTPVAHLPSEQIGHEPPESSRATEVAAELGGGDRSSVDSSRRYGVLRLVEEISRAPVGGVIVSVRYEDKSRSALSLLGDEDGRVRLPVGEVTVSIDTSGWRILEGSAAVREAEEVVVSLLPTSTITVQVVSLDLRPIAKAEVTWSLCSLESARQLGCSESPPQLTDSAGQARVPDCPSSGCFWHVRADGYVNVNEYARPHNELVLLKMSAADHGLLLDVQDAATGVPVEGVSCREVHGSVRLHPEGIGRYRLFVARGSSQTLWFRAPGFVATPAQPSSPKEGPAVVRMHAASRLIAEHGGDSEPCRVWVLSGASGQHGVEPAAALRVKPGGKAVFTVPANESLKLVSVTPSGRGFSIPVTVPTGGEHLVKLEFGRNEQLKVRVADRRGERLWIKYADALYDGLKSVRIEGDEGEVYVPCSANVRRVDLHVVGVERVRLKLANARMRERGGIVDIVLGRAQDVAVRVIDDGGNAVGGVSLYLRGNDMSVAQAAHPELRGCWPTGHPAWVLRRQVDTYVRTDYNGVASLLLTPGEYTIDVRLPWGREGPRNGSYLAQQQLKATIVGGQTQLTCRVARSRRIDLYVMDGRGIPLRRVRVAAKARGWSKGVDVGGPYISCVMPWNVDEFIVSAAGYKSKRLGVSSLGEGPVHLRLDTGDPESNGELTIEGDVGSLVGKRVLLEGVRDGSVGSVVVWKSEMVLDERARARFFVPASDQLRMRLRLEVDGRRVIDVQPLWVPNGRVRFAVE